MSARAIDAATLPYETVKASLEYIAENLRSADLDEIRASVELEPAAALIQSWLASSRMWLITDRTGLPIAAFGAAPSEVPGVGVVWLLGTEGVAAEWVAVARQTRRFINEMHEEFPTLWNFVDARNDHAVDWLLHSGFHLIDADSAHGPERRLFYEFARTA